MDEEENIGTDSAATLVGRDIKVPVDPDVDEEKEKTRTQWDNKIQYLLAQIGFAVRPRASRFVAFHFPKLKQPYPMPDMNLVA